MRASGDLQHSQVSYAVCPAWGEAGLTRKATVTPYQPDDLHNIPERVQGMDDNPDCCGDVDTKPGWEGS